MPVCNRRGVGSSSRRSLNIGRSVHTVEVTSSYPRGRFSERDLLQIVHHLSQRGGTVGFELRYVTDPSLDYESLVRLDEQLMRQRNAAPKDVISALPEVVATESDLDIRCVVCMCDVELGEKLRLLPCAHKYHKNCIDGKFFPCFLLITCNFGVHHVSFLTSVSLCVSLYRVFRMAYV